MEQLVELAEQLETDLDRAHGQPLAGLACVVRQMELGLRPLLYRGWGQG